MALVTTAHSRSPSAEPARPDSPGEGTDARPAVAQMLADLRAGLPAFGVRPLARVASCPDQADAERDAAYAALDDIARRAERDRPEGQTFTWCRWCRRGAQVGRVMRHALWCAASRAQEALAAKAAR